MANPIQIFHMDSSRLSDLGHMISESHVGSYLFGVLRHFEYCTGHITTGSWKGRGNQYIQLVKVLYCKLPTNGKQLPTFTLEAMPGTEPRPQRWEARVLPLCHRGMLESNNTLVNTFSSFML